MRRLEDSPHYDKITGMIADSKEVTTLVGQYFSKVSSITRIVAIDADTSEPYLHVTVETPLPPAEAAEAHAKFDAVWQARTPNNQVRFLFLETHRQTFKFGHASYFTNERGDFVTIDGGEYFMDKCDQRFGVWKRILDRSVSQNQPVYVEYDEDKRVHHLFQSMEEKIDSVGPTFEGKTAVVFYMSPSLYYLYESNVRCEEMKKRAEEAASTREGVRVVIDPTTTEILYVG